MSINLPKIKSFDFTLFILVFLLVVIGLVLQYSLSFAGTGVSFSRHLIFVLIGFLFFGLVYLIDFRFIKATAFFIYLLSLILLILVLFLGKSLRGTSGWLDFGFFNFQPAELAKLATIIILAKFWQKAPAPVKIKHVLYSFLLIAPLFLLIARQPDFGSAITIVLIWLGVLFLVDSNKKHFLSLLLIFILIASLAWFFIFEDYQKDRVLTLLQPSRDVLKSGYQVNQSVIAVGSGQFWGRGFALGTQSQLKFLPDSGTDFIFAVLGEEFGLLGGLFFLLVYFLFLARLVRIARQVYGNFSLVLVCGVMIYFSFQMLINVGMNLGVAPVVGLPLPLISYGGSSLLISLICLGLVESVLRHQPFSRPLNNLDQEGFMLVGKGE
ncbi:rod shape-determining protein RodA [Patescibacteria group bacterium]|nr:rod shape-determining protein RodA [Patescibacteria group bacterium]